MPTLMTTLMATDEHFDAYYDEHSDDHSADHSHNHSHDHKHFDDHSDDHYDDHSACEFHKNWHSICCGDEQFLADNTLMMDGRQSGFAACYGIHAFNEGFFPSVHIFIGHFDTDP